MTDRQTLNYLVNLGFILGGFAEISGLCAFATE